MFNGLNELHQNDVHFFVAVLWLLGPHAVFEVLQELWVDVHTRIGSLAQREELPQHDAVRPDVALGAEYAISDGLQ